MQGIAPQTIRRLAFQALFQLDAQLPLSASSPDVESIRTMLKSDGGEGYGEEAITLAIATAQSAFAGRAESDKLFTSFAPTWPAHRQPAVDRAILRLAFYELKLGAAPFKSVINDAVGLASEFSTEKSPGFVNALLDRAHQTLVAAAKVQAEDSKGAEAAESVEGAAEQGGDGPAAGDAEPEGKN
jgi:transcription antitermination protein NusB